MDAAADHHNTMISVNSRANGRAMCVCTTRSRRAYVYVCTMLYAAFSSLPSFRSPLTAAYFRKILVKRKDGRGPKKKGEDRERVFIEKERGGRRKRG